MPALVVYFNQKLRKEVKIMKYRVYNEKNYSERMGCYLPTYFRTKREAIAHAEKIGNATIERKICSEWVAY
jgi:hypothetical protein